MKFSENTLFGTNIVKCNKNSSNSFATILSIVVLMKGNCDIGPLDNISLSRLCFNKG